MIKKITLHNFQSHKHTELIVSPNITSIVGLSDSGKSSFLRGLKALLYRDSFYMRALESDGYVEVEFDNGTVRREQSIAYPKKCHVCKEKVELTQKCTNPNCGVMLETSVVFDRYVINGEVKEKFGAKLPEFIKDVLKFYETNFVDFEVALNFFSQHEDMFFIGQTYAGGARNKIMSCLVPDSNKVDILLKKVGTEYQEKKILSESLLLENIVLENKIKDGKHDAEEIERLSFEVKQNELKLDKLTSNISRLNKLKSDIEEAYKKSKYLKQIQTISTNIQKVKQFVEVKLAPQLSKIVRLKSLSVVPKKFDVDLKKELPKIDFDAFNEQLKKIQRLKELQTILTASYMHQERLYAEEDVLDKKLTQKRKTYNEALGESLCPITQDKYCESCISKLKV